MRGTGCAMGIDEFSETQQAADRRNRSDADAELRVDWAASCRLALVVSILAAAAALALATVVGETALVVMVIVAASIVSWFHLESGQLTRPIPAHRD